MILQRRKPLDSRIERQLITGMIISERFIREIKPILKLDSLQLPFVKIIAKWCLEFFENHQTAPAKTIQDIFIERRKYDLDPDQAELIEDFLTSISDEYQSQDTFNIDYYLKKVKLHLRNVSLQNLAKEITKAVNGGRIEEAEALVKGYERPVMAQAQGVDPINDNVAIAGAFSEDSRDKLFALPGAIGQVIGELERGWLFAVVGASGVGKTWWLMLIALRALFAGYNVIFISLEMSEKAMIRRIHHYINGLPTRRWAGEMLIPIFDCELNQKGTCKKPQRTGLIDLIGDEEDGEIPHFDDAPKKYKPCTECMGSRDFVCSSWFRKTTKEELTIGQIFKKKQALKRSALIRGSKFHLVEFPSGSLTMSELKAYLYNLEQYEGFVPDVIVTDYADKFKPEFNREYRHGINEIWEGHKGLAQEKNALVVSGSQSNTSRSGKRIGQGDWAEDIRKLNLVDGGIALNMTPEQKLRGIMECGMMKLRHDYFDTLGSVNVLHQLKIGRPYLSSYAV
jgi:replicative DNA helicase